MTLELLELAVVAQLPPDVTIARTARTHVTAALEAAGAPKETIHAAALVVSELATNACQHVAAKRPRAHEASELRVELRVAKGNGTVHIEVFDSGLDFLEAGTAPEELTENGRGLGIVSAIAEGRWGCCQSSSHLGSRVPGKIVWAVLSLAP